MDTNAQVKERVFTEPSTESLDVASTINPRLDDADTVRHSEGNILKWMKYLPEDCIHRMIEMEWDITT
jgi:hypothetical protein